MAVRSDRGHLGPWQAIVRWKLASFGLACRPTSDEHWRGIVRDDAGTERGSDAYLQLSGATAKLKPTNQSGRNMDYANRYWHDGNSRALTWWGSPLKYVGGSNFGDGRWTVVMSPDDSLTSGIYNDQPTRYAETFYGDYFYYRAPLGFVPEGPYQAYQVADETRPEGGGTTASFDIRPINPALFYRGRAVMSPAVAYGQWSGAAIAEFPISGRWILAVEQEREQCSQERVLAARLDGTGRVSLASYAYYIAEDSPTYLDSTGYILNWGEWVFSPDGTRAAAIRKTGSFASPSSPIIYTKAHHELVFSEDASGNLSVSRSTIPWRSPQPGDYYVTCRGVERVNDDASNVGVFNAGWGGDFYQEESVLGLEYDPDGVLRFIWQEHYDSSDVTGPDGLQVMTCGVDHVDCRDSVLVARIEASDGQRLVVVWHGQVLVNHLYAPLDRSYDSSSFAVAVRVVTLNGCAAVTVTGSHLAVSVPMIERKATLAWNPFTGFYHNGIWYSDAQRKFYTGVWQRDPDTGVITQILDESAIADLAGLAGDTKVRLYPVAPI